MISMPSLIRILPDLLVNQIAAGEVIEDPASVVKELVENAIDAGSQRIEIELIGGGHRLIRVSDDGHGMSHDDAVLCFERHATSKIHKEEDLQKIITMGFRGEALAAIAAIGKVSLKTSLKSGEGTFVEIQGGKLLNVEPSARTRGTTIEVRDLFYNVPARRKFQKSAVASSMKIERWISLFSLGHPEIEFQFAEQEKKMLFTARGNCLAWQKEVFLDQLKGRVIEIFGKEFTGIELDQRREDLHLQGFISAPACHRPQRSGQTVFINRRLVQAPLISQAIREAYATRLPEGRHPLFVIHLAISPSEVDVNVHPQKREVRFKEEAFLRDFVRASVLNAFEKETVPVYVDFQPVEQFPWTLQETKETNPYVQSELPLTSSVAKGIALLWQFFLIEGLILVDLQKALERIMYDGFTKKTKKIETQKLLIPLKIELNKNEAEALRGRVESLDRLGLKICEMGEQFFLIEEIPASWNAEMVKESLLSFLSEEESSILPSFQRCVKAKFLLQEAEEILRTLLQSSDPHKTPHGEPIMVRLEESDLRSLFSHGTK